jgi:hypothetical protein
MQAPSLFAYTSKIAGKALDLITHMHMHMGQSMELAIGENKQAAVAAVAV